MQPKFIYVSKDQDNVIKFWKSRPYYNDPEDEFHGETAELLPQTVKHLKEIAEKSIEMGTCEPFLLVGKNLQFPSILEQMKKVKDSSEDNIIRLIENRFHQYVSAFGIEGERNEWGDCLGINLTPFHSRIIRFRDSKTTADEEITAVLAYPEAEEGELEFCQFVVKTTNISYNDSEWADAKEIVKDNANHCFGLLELLEKLESHIVYEKAYDENSRKDKELVLASKMENMVASSVMSGNDEIIKPLPEKIKKLMDVDINDGKSHFFADCFMPYGRFVIGALYVNVPGKELKDTYDILGKSTDDKNGYTWWIHVNPITKEPVPTDNEKIPYLEIVRGSFLKITGKDTNDPEIISGFDFISELVADSDSYDREAYNGKF